MRDLRRSAAMWRSRSPTPGRDTASFHRAWSACAGVTDSRDTDHCEWRIVMLMQEPVRQFLQVGSIILPIPVVGAGTPHTRLRDDLCVTAWFESRLPPVCAPLPARTCSSASDRDRGARK
jgi:hypothetical protein